MEDVSANEAMKLVLPTHQQQGQELHHILEVIVFKVTSPRPAPSQVYYTV